MVFQKEPIPMISKNKEKTRNAYTGFSFTACLLSPFVQMFRKDLKGTILYMVIFWIFGQLVIPYLVYNFGPYVAYLGNAILWIFCGFTYNKVQMLILLNDGYRPIKKTDADFLAKQGYYVK